MASGLAFLVVTLVVAGGLTHDLDRAALAAAQAIASAPLDLVSSALSALGGVLITGAIAALLTVRGVAREGLRGAVPVLIVAAIAIEYVLKRVIDDPAPPATLLRDFHWLAIGDPATGGSAYPSGHLARTAFLATISSATWPVLRWPAAIIVLLMAVSRVYSASHWTSDVVGGLCLGLAIGFAAVAIERRTAR